MKKKVIGILLIVFGGINLFSAILMGIIFYITGAAMGSAKDILDEEWEVFSVSALETVGYITDDDDGTTVEYYSEVDGRKYTAQFSFENSKYPEGETITVYYDPNDPSECMIPDLSQGTLGLLEMVFSGIGIVVFLICALFGVAMLVGGILLEKKGRKELAASR